MGCSRWIYFFFLKYFSWLSTEHIFALFANCEIVRWIGLGIERAHLLGNPVVKGGNIILEKKVRYGRTSLKLYPSTILQSKGLYNF